MPLFDFGTKPSKEGFMLQGRKQFLTQIECTELSEIYYFLYELRWLSNSIIRYCTPGETAVPGYTGNAANQLVAKNDNVIK